jgi:hypothetical protein
VVIQALSQSAAGVGAQVVCFADSGAGSFTVPAAIMGALPVPYSLQGIPQGSLAVLQFLGTRISIPGTDSGNISAFDAYNVGPINFQ